MDSLQNYNANAWLLVYFVCSNTFLRRFLWKAWCKSSLETGLITLLICLAGDLLKLLDISWEERVLLTTYGKLQPPLGKHRLKVHLLLLKECLLSDVYSSRMFCIQLITANLLCITYITSLGCISMLFHFFMSFQHYVLISELINTAEPKSYFEQWLGLVDYWVHLSLGRCQQWSCRKGINSPGCCEAYSKIVFRVRYLPISVSY